MNENLRKLQLTQLMILKDVAKICEDHCLTYYLTGGTLLGAVRHKGFIPWDDDIDVAMFRADYNKLFEIMKKDYADKYFVQRFESDRNYTRYIMKIRLNNTKHIEEANKNIEMHQGIYIDIFPLDYIVYDEKNLEKRGKKMDRLFALKNIKHKSYFSTKKKRILAFFLRFITFFISDKKINRMFEKVCEVDNEKKCDYVTNFAGQYKWKNESFPVSCFGNGVSLMFEDQKFNAPQEYEKVLSQFYGDDYMEIPPQNKRIQHNIIEVDFGKYN